MLRVACLPGDGIGPEVTAVAIEVLRALPIEIEVEEHSFGGGAILAQRHAASRTDARRVSGRPTPSSWARSACLGLEGAPVDGLEQGLIGLRKALSTSSARIRPPPPDRTWGRVSTC